MIAFILGICAFFVGIGAVALVVIDDENLLENHRAGSPYDYNERDTKNDK